LSGACELCPRRCGVDRNKGEVGFCRAGSAVEIYRYAPHHGEEPPISGSNGSGTIFFSRCTLACLYCQNYPWSQEGAGTIYDEDQLASVFQQLAEAGCHNWNLVSPTPWLPQIAAAVDSVKQGGIQLPVVFNSSGYERVETLDKYSSLVDIYLADLRYAYRETAREGSRAEDYVGVAREAMEMMWQRLGPLRCDKNEVAVSGVVCRLLILPGHAEEVVANLEWMAEKLGTTVPVSIMAQYHPAYRADGRLPWNRGISREEYDYVCEAVDSLGFETGWVQEYTSVVDDELVGHQMPQGGFNKTQ
jgi:putative pyruvate formate lyase activating enzyme